MNLTDISTLGELKKAKYIPKSIKNELRDNLLLSIKNNSNPFDGIYGYEDTVIPDIKRALLSRHNIILLGLRGQAKTRIARLLVNLLDEFIPIISGSEINDDPFHPVSYFGKDVVKKMGDNTPVSWLHRDERYAEKLATPDVSVADLIGDIDPIKAANLKLPYSDERVIHFGLIPHSHRSIFVINELPDLQARIQVALFNILQEEDIQIRGFKMKLPLDIQFIFTANPEDYTNRGSIVTPLKDRIDSQILTHYPKSLDISKQITKQEAKLLEIQKAIVSINPLLEDLVEIIAVEARKSEYIDEKSGVSARLTISAYENLVSSAELRLNITGEKSAEGRVTDLYSLIPSITGKIELVYEGEQEGPAKVAQILISKAIRSKFLDLFPNPESGKKTGNSGKEVYKEIMNWFGKGNKIDLMLNMTEKEYNSTLSEVPGLDTLVMKYIKPVDENTKYLYMEFVLHGLAEFSILSKFKIGEQVGFKDLLSTMFSITSELESDDENYDEYR